MAAKCLELGADLYICGRRREPLERTSADLTAKHGGSVKCHTADIRDAEGVDAMVQAIWEDGGPLTGLLNNAAGNFISRTEDLSPRGFDAIAPGIFPTEGAGKRLAPGRDAGRDASAVNPMRRAGKMEELQNLAAFLMADGCEFLTGQTIAVDGAACLVNGGSFNELFAWTDADWEKARAAIKAQNEKDKQQRTV